MATSLSWDFGQTAGELIQAAYEDLGVVSPGVAATTAEITLARSRLNTIVKQLQGRSDGAPGLKIHTRQRITLLLAKGQQSYLIGPGSSDARASTAMGRTTVATAYASGTSLVVTSNTDTTSYPGTTITMTNSDFIGVELDNGTIAYTTISSVAGAPTITLTGGLSSAASVGNYVWWFTARAQRFPYIESAVLRDENFNDTPLDVFTEVAQYDLGVPSKFADATPTAILVEPLRLNTRVTLDSQPTEVTRTIVLTVFYPAEDYDAVSDEIAFPQEALEFLRFELMFKLAPANGRWTPEMEQGRKESRAMYMSLNPENSTLAFEPGGP